MQFRAIIDRGCAVPEGMEIGFDHKADRARGFRVSEAGVVLVTPGMLGYGWFPITMGAPPDPAAFAAAADRVGGFVDELRKEKVRKKAATKAMNELYAEVFRTAYGYESIGLRYFNVFGPRQAPGGPYAAVIPNWYSSLLRGEPVYINGDGETSRDFCHIDNAVQPRLYGSGAAQ